MPNRLDELRDALFELNPDALTLDGLDRALIGYTLPAPTRPAVAVYSWSLAVRVVLEMLEDGARLAVDIGDEGAPPTQDEAEEYLAFNSLGAAVGDSGPVFAEILPHLAGAG